MENPFIIGRRTYLRPLELKDAARVVPWLNDPEIIRNLARTFPLNLLVEEDFIRNMYKAVPLKQVIFGIILKVDEALIGVTGLHAIDWVNRRAETDILIGIKKYWNRGLGTEAKNLLLDYAFRTLNLNTLVARLIDTNQRAIAACVKQGYKEAGRLRRAIFREGTYHDEVLMELLREEWTEPSTIEGIELPTRGKD